MTEPSDDLRPTNMAAVRLGGALGGLLCAALLWTACPGMQRLSVRTVPDGAEVSLARQGVRWVEGLDAYFDGMARLQGPFEDPAEPLGRSPLTIEFELEAVDSLLGLPDGEARLMRLVRGGVVRAVLGELRAERRVSFSGEPVELVLELSRPEAGGGAE